MLNETQRKRLLAIARQSIESVLAGRRPAVTDTDEATDEANDEANDEADEELRRPAGAFVTLRTRDGELRGCIGSIVARQPLLRAGGSSARNPAFPDPRFVPVTAEELPGPEREIPGLGPM